MKQTNVCKKIEFFIGDETSAEKEYAEFDLEGGDMKDKHTLLHLSMDEAKHKRFWKEMDEKLCK